MAFASSLSARDDVKYHSLDFLNGPKAKEFLLPNVSISFGTGYTGKVIVRDLTSNKKTNGFNKSDERGLPDRASLCLKVISRKSGERGRHEGCKFDWILQKTAILTLKLSFSAAAVL